MDKKILQEFPSPSKSEPEDQPERKKPKRDVENKEGKPVSDEQGKDLASCNLALLESKEFCDLTFAVGRDLTCQQQFKCHKFVLVSRSPVFRAMFADRWKRTSSLNAAAGESKPINLNDIDPDSFDRFLQFLYGDVFNVVKVQDVDGLLYLARKYDVELLTEKCAQYLKSNVTIKDVVSVYKTANFYSLGELEQTCREFVRKNMGGIIEKGRFKDFNPPTLIDALRTEGLNVREIQLFRAIVRWGRLLVVESVDDPPLPEPNCSIEPSVATVMRQILKDVLPLVRFPLMSVENISNVVHPSGLLNPDDLSAVYQYACLSPEERKKLCGTLRFSTSPRTQSLGSEMFIELYTPKSEGLKPTVDPSTIEYCRAKARAHVETLKFSVHQVDNSASPSVFISTLVLRGPHDDSIIGSSQFNTIFSTWTVNVTLTAYKRLYGRKCPVETFHKKNIPVYASREVYLDVVPAIRLQQKNNVTYCIRIQYEADVNFPADYTVLTGSKLKSAHVIPSSLPWLLTEMTLESDEPVAVEGVEPIQPKATHCIRAIGFRERNSDMDHVDPADDGWS